MAHQQYNPQYPPPQNGQYPPPVQTQNLHQYQQQRPPYSPPSSYQQSPTAMSPQMGSGIPPAKRQRLSPNPQSPSTSHYQSPFAASPYPQSQPQSPYAGSPQFPMSLPASSAPQQPPPFHQPQPYQHPNAMNQHPAPQGSMPPPKVPASKAQDDTLEKGNARDMDVNNLSDVLSGGIVDLRAEEEMLLHSYSNRNQGASFNSQMSGSTATPGGSFNNWSQQGEHGAYQGTGPMSQTLTPEQQNAELLRKHEQAARILNESSQHPLTDPFIAANVLRHRIAKRAYDTGISVNVDGLFDKIPEKNPRDVERRVRDGANGEQVVGLEAASLLNQNAPLVDIIALLTLAAEERVRTIVEDAYALSQGRQHTSHGIIPPQMVEIAVIEQDAESKVETPVNILKTPWEYTETATSPNAIVSKLPQSAARLPTPPSEAPLTPKPTYQNSNHVARALKCKVEEDEKYEKERMKRREKRRKGDEAKTDDGPTEAIVIPEKLSKKQKDAEKKAQNTDSVLHKKTNATASMALGFGKKKKYAWMTGGTADAPTSGTSTPKTTTAAGANSGTATPAGASAGDKLVGKKRTYGLMIEKSVEIGASIQIRDLVHVLENDGHERKTLSLMLARLKNTESDEKQDARVPTSATR